jgi:hypothetical protein
MHIESCALCSSLSLSLSTSRRRCLIALHTPLYRCRKENVLAVTTNSKMKNSFQTWHELLVTVAPEHIE